MRRVGRSAVSKAMAATAVAVAIAVVAPAGPANADEAGTGAAAFNQCGGAHCVVGALTTRIYPTGLGTDVVEFECDVTGSGDAVSTTVSTCSVGSVNALLSPLSAPGPTVATAGVGLFPAGSTVTACVGGSAVWAEGVLGPVSLSGSGCGRTIVLAV